MSVAGNQAAAYNGKRGLSDDDLEERSNVKEIWLLFASLSPALEGLGQAGERADNRRKNCVQDAVAELKDLTPDIINKNQVVVRAADVIYIVQEMEVSLVRLGLIPADIQTAITAMRACMVNCIVN